MKTNPVSEQPVLKPLEKKEWLAIINPAAGFHIAPGWLPRLEARLKHSMGAKVVISRGLDHIIELLNESGRFTDLAVFGGDGTIAEVVNRMDLEHQRLLPLPGGTGNGLARDLCLTSIDRALDAVRADCHTTIDILQVTFGAGGQKILRLAVSTSGLGYTTDTVIFSSRLFRPLGSLRYALAGLAQAVQMPAYSISVHVDNQPPQERLLTNIMVNNTQHAGCFPIFHTACLDNCQMDVLLSENQFWEQTIENLALLVHNHAGNFHRDHCFARSLTLRTSTPMRLMLDGEIWNGVNEVSFAISPKKLKCYSRSVQLT